MGSHSVIGATWNPVTGCTHVSEVCRQGHACKDVMLHQGRLEAPLHWKKPRRIFVNSLSDLFHEDVPDEFIDKIFAVMAMTPDHTYQILTKRPARMLEYLAHQERHSNAVLFMPDWPPANVWLGVSCEDQKTADERIPLLLQIPVAVRFISAEPLLGPINLEGICSTPACFNSLLTGRYPKLDWVIVGGESGPHARPMHPGWARSIRDQCQAAGVPFFFKQHGEWEPVCDYYDDLITKQSHEWIVGIPGERHDGQPPLGTWIMRKVAKKVAGRMLDGRTWDEMPT